MFVLHRGLILTLFLCLNYCIWLKGGRTFREIKFKRIKLVGCGALTPLVVSLMIDRSAPQRNDMTSWTHSAEHLFVAWERLSLCGTCSFLVCVHVSSSSSFSVAGLGTWQRRGSCHGNRTTQLPGQRPCGIRDRSEEVHRVLHLSAVLHHTWRRPPQPT